jgi:hypothetical protein
VTFEADRYLLDSDAPWRIGNGSNGPWNGRLADVRVYRRVLNDQEIGALAKQRPTR